MNRLRLCFILHPFVCTVGQSLQHHHHHLSRISRSLPASRMRIQMTIATTEQSYFFALTFFGGVGALSVASSVFSVAFRFDFSPSADFFVLVAFGES